MQTISPTLIFALRSQKIIHLLPGEHGEILGRKCSSTPTSSWIESSSTESHVILGGGVAAGCLFTFVVALRGNVCDSRAFLLTRLLTKEKIVCLFWDTVQAWSFEEENKHSIYTAAVVVVDGDDDNTVYVVVLWRFLFWTHSHWAVFIVYKPTLALCRTLTFVAISLSLVAFLTGICCNICYCICVFMYI